MGPYSSVFNQNTHIDIDCWNNNSGTAGIDQVRIGSMAQLDAGSGSEQSGHIRDTPLGPAVNLTDFLKADMCFQHFWLDSFDLERIWWLFSLTASEMSKIVAFHFLFANIGKLKDFEDKQKESSLNII